MSQGTWSFTNCIVPGRKGARLQLDQLDLAAGVTAVLGPSGAGKTTLLDSAVGALRLPRDCVVQRPASLAWAPADGGLWPGMRVEEQLRAVCPAHETQRLERGRALFALDDCWQAPPEELSRGEIERVACARALCAEAQALVFDEPLAHVDMARAGSMWQQTLEWCAERQQSVLFATHESSRVIAWADQVVCLAAGRVRVHQPLAQLYWHPASPADMLLLGHGNWWSEAEAALLQGAPAECCVRPEQVQLEPVVDGSLTVAAHVFHGAWAETDLQCNGQTVRVCHRPSQPLRRGMTLRVRILA